MGVKVEILTTADLSKTLHLPEIGEHYHSKHGALTEAEHVYINAGLHLRLQQMNYKGDLHIFELGLGTAMNAALTAAKVAAYTELHCFYTAIEPVALTPEQSALFSEESWALQVPFAALHDTPWGEFVEITNNFSLKKLQITFEAYEPDHRADLIYYDAFGPRVQPNLWEPWALEKCANFMNSGAIWVSYCAKGSVRRALQTAGLCVERMPGPPGKREMLRAVKT